MALCFAGTTAFVAVVVAGDNPIAAMEKRESEFGGFPLRAVPRRPGSYFSLAQTSPRLTPYKRRASARRAVSCSAIVDSLKFADAHSSRL